MRNEYGVCGFESDKGFDFRWLGATVSFVLFGERRTGRVLECDNWHKSLVVELWDGTKHVRVSGAYQNFRKEKQNHERQD